MSILPLLALAACSGPIVTYDSARAACGLDPGEHQPLPYGVEGPLHAIDDACATALGDLLELDGATFGAEAAGFEWPASPLDNVLGAAYTLIASDLGTIADLEAVMLPGEVAALALADAPGGRSYTRGEPAAALWVEFLAEAVDRTVWNDEVAGEAHFDSGLLEVDFAPGDDDALLPDEHPVYFASALIHEASHAHVPHVACESGELSCDADGLGAYGAQIRWVTSWREANIDTVSSEDLLAVRLPISDACRMILDTSGVPACAEERR